MDRPEELAAYSRSLFFPLLLMLNLSVFQYLVLLFHARWREPRVQLLLLISGISVATLVPFATQTDATIGSLNDVSESCLALILLVQTALVDSRHSKGPSATTRASKPLQLVADVLIVFDCSVVVLGLVCVFRPQLANDFGGTIVLNNVAENATLAFTFVHRFGELGLAKGWRTVLREDRRELAFHVVFMLHEYPFALLEHLTASSWEYVQAVFMRLALTPCVWMTIGEHHAQRLSVFLGRQPEPSSRVEHARRSSSIASKSGDRESSRKSNPAVVFAAEDAVAHDENDRHDATGYALTLSPGLKPELDEVCGLVQGAAALESRLDRSDTDDTRSAEQSSTATADG